MREDGRFDDLVLAAYENTPLKRDGVAIVTPLGSADVEVLGPPTAESIYPQPVLRDARCMRAPCMTAGFANGVEWLR